LNGIYEKERGRWEEQKKERLIKEGRKKEGEKK
jgi:hypothetical protein